MDIFAIANPLRKKTDLKQTYKIYLCKIKEKILINDILLSGKTKCTYQNH